jgi:hypothetical protein
MTEEDIALAKSRRELLLSISPNEWMAWRHSPISAAFLQYLADQITYMRGAAADMLEAGGFVPGHQHQDRNPDTLRGQIVMLRQLHDLELHAIQGFYGQELPEAAQEHAE